MFTAVQFSPLLIYTTDCKQTSGRFVNSFSLIRVPKIDELLRLEICKDNVSTYLNCKLSLTSISRPVTVALHRKEKMAYAMRF